MTSAAVKSPKLAGELPTSVLVAELVTRLEKPDTYRSMPLTLNNLARLIQIEEQENDRDFQTANRAF